MAAGLTGLFGLLVIVGGVVGYVNTGSVPSLIAGSSFGLLLVASAYLINNKKTQDRGYLLSLGNPPPQTRLLLSFLWAYVLTIALQCCSAC